MTQGSAAFRAAGAEDRAAAVASWQAAGLVVAWNDPEQDFDRFLASDNAAVLLFDEGDAIAATVAVGHDGHRGWVYYLACHPERRRQGLGRQAMAAAEDWLAARGIAKLQLMVRPSNAAVSDFYRALDYDESPRRIFVKWLPRAPQAAPLPHARVIVTYMEQTEPVIRAVPQPPARLPVALMRLGEPSLDFYRFLYRGAGEGCVWWERCLLSDDELSQVIRDPACSIHVLYAAGEPAGYAELVTYEEERRVDIAYFGLLPAWRGKKLGGFLLARAVELAWADKPEKVTVNTCTLDHPAALPLYQRHGFQPVRREHLEIVDPRARGLV